MRTKHIFFALAVWALAGCASVEVKRGNDLSNAGIAYSQATSALLEVAVDSMINADSEAHVRSKLPKEALSDPQYSPEEMRERLKRSDADLISNVELIMTLKASVGSIESYFKGLQTLADNSQSAATATAVSSLADTINGLNGALKNSKSAVKPIISDSQKAALSGLAKIVADQVHGKIVSDALKRDAKVIGEAILLQEQLIGFAEGVIAADMNETATRFYVDSVRAPYEIQAIDKTWVTNRRAYIRTKATGKMLEAVKLARDASKQMGKTWEKILSGVYDGSDMISQLKELDSIVSALVAIKNAEKPVTPTK